MKNTRILSTFFFVFLVKIAAAQNVTELENRMAAENNKTTKARLCLQIAEKYLSGNPTKSTEFANRAAGFASEVNDKSLEADARFLHGEGYSKLRDFNAAATRYKMGVAAGKSAGASGLETTLDCLDKLAEISTRNKDYKTAFDYSQQAVDLLQKGSPASSTREQEKKLAVRRDAIEQEKLRLEAEKKQLSDDIANLAHERDQLKTGLSSKSQELEKSKTESDKIISTKEEELANLSEKKDALDKLSSTHTRQIANLTKDQIADSLLISKQKNIVEQQKSAIATQKLKERQAEYLRNLLLLLSGFVLLLAGLFYARYRTKKKSTEVLEQKNKAIEAERERSDNLLLNILPPAIAAELRTEGRAVARKYEKATVMFVDFVNFTNVAERLSPEALVEELDYCFRQFDTIIGQFNIEKIKTIGDAYMAANGLSDRNTLPDDMIKAALEIQEFLIHLKLERSRRGLPFFEARIGIHTGPVVAGVVGAKKFAYDIWGDTVNLAARMEQACEPGRVNVSEATQNLSQYIFKFENRGKIAAKNKGEIEMFYVAGRY
jgi:adenylate cyclase